MIRKETELTIEYLKGMQEKYIEGEGYERHSLPEWYALDKAIELLEQTRWIPVNERLPKKDGEYLLFGKVVEEDTDGTFIGMYDVCAEKFGSWENYYDRNTLGFLGSELIEYNKVIAWMPLPSAYERGVEK